MAGKRYNQEQILSIVKEHEEGLSTQDVISKYGVTKTTSVSYTHLTLPTILLV